MTRAARCFPRIVIGTVVVAITRSPDRGFATLQANAHMPEPCRRYVRHLTSRLLEPISLPPRPGSQRPLPSPAQLLILPGSVDWQPVLRTGRCGAADLQ